MSKSFAIHVWPPTFKGHKITTKTINSAFFTRSLTTLRSNDPIIIIHYLFQFSFSSEHSYSLIYNSIKCMFNQTHIPKKSHRSHLTNTWYTPAVLAWWPMQWWPISTVNFRVAYQTNQEKNPSVNFKLFQQ